MYLEVTGSSRGAIYVFDDALAYRLAADGDQTFAGDHATSRNGVAFTGAAFVLDRNMGSVLLDMEDPDHPDSYFYGHEVDFRGGLALVGGWRFVGSRPPDLVTADLWDVAMGAVVHRFADPTPAELGAFGGSVTVGDGWAAVSERRANGGTGVVYLFDTDSGALLHTLEDPDGATRGFGGHYMDTDDGQRLALCSTAGTGAGCHLFDAPSGTLLQSLPGAQTVYDVSLSGDFLATADPFAYGPTGVQGIVEIWDLRTNALVLTLEDPAGGGNVFGVSVELRGERLVVGASTDDTAGVNAGAVYVYDLDLGIGDDGFEICHIPPGNPDNAHTIVVDSEKAVETHIEKHGDTLGPCEGGGGRRGRPACSGVAVGCLGVVQLGRWGRGRAVGRGRGPGPPPQVGTRRVG